MQNWDKCIACTVLQIFANKACHTVDTLCIEKMQILWTCTLNIAKTAWVERESVRQVRDASPHSKHFHLNSPLKTTPCHPQGCSHNLTVISANICCYSSALRAQQREVVSRSRSLQIRWHKNTSRTPTARVWNPGQPSFSCFCMFLQGMHSIFPGSNAQVWLTLWEQPWGQAQLKPLLVLTVESLFKKIITHYL